MSMESIFKLSLVMNMVDRLSGPMAGIASKVGADVAGLDALSQTFGSTANAGAAMASMGAQITGAVLAPVEAAFETRRALGELSSLGIRDLDALESAARDFSGQWAGTTKSDFISAAYDIKSGVASLTDEGVAQFTELAGLTAKATKSAIGEMTSLFATGYGIYKDYYSDLSDLEFGEMFSAGIAQSVKQFKTTGSGMAQSIQTLGASATTANVPLEEQLSILGMLQSTMGGSEAGTKYKAFLRSAAKGGEALGLSFTDANNQLLSMPEILDKLRGKFGEAMDAAEKMELQQAFGDTEAVALIDLMYNKVGDLQDNILGMYDALGSGTGVAADMANAINETEPERLQRLQQQIHNVTESIGDSLLPTVNDLMGRGEQLLTKAGAWIENNQALVKVIMLVVLALGGFLAVGGTAVGVIGGLGLVFTKTAGYGKIFIGAVKNIPDTLDTIRLYGMFAGDAVKAGFTKMRAAGGIAVTAVKNVGRGLALMAKQALTAVSTALTPLISTVWSFTAALLANPVTWVVIGIVALIAAVILLYNKCEWFRNGVDAILSFLKEKITALPAAAAAVFQDLVTGISSKLTAARTAVSDGLGLIEDAIAGAGTWLFESGRKVITTFTGGISSAWTGAVDTVKGGLQKIRDLLPFSDAKEGPLSSLTLSGQRTMTTFASGLAMERDTPARTVEDSLRRTGSALERAPVKRLGRGGDGGDKTGSGGGETSGGGKKLIIQKLILQTDMKTIKDLKGLIALLDEMEDIVESGGFEEDGDPDAGYQPA